MALKTTTGGVSMAVDGFCWRRPSGLGRQGALLSNSASSILINSLSCEG
jgi:hypothetical protein